MPINANLCKIPLCGTKTNAPSVLRKSCYDLALALRIADVVFYLAQHIKGTLMGDENHIAPVLIGGCLPATR